MLQGKEISRRITAEEKIIITLLLTPSEISVIQKMLQCEVGINIKVKSGTLGGTAMIQFNGHIW